MGKQNISLFHQTDYLDANAMIKPNLLAGKKE